MKQGTGRQPMPLQEYVSLESRECITFFFTLGSYLVSSIHSGYWTLSISSMKLPVSIINSDFNFKRLSQNDLLHIPLPEKIKEIDNFILKSVKLYNHNKVFLWRIINHLTTLEYPCCVQHRYFTVIKCASKEYFSGIVQI